MFHLPAEVLEQIFRHLQGLQSTLHACCLTNRAWYESAVPFLYDFPQISGKNFDTFVNSVCPSALAHIRRNGLGELVRVLDMSGLVHSSKKSLTARLIGRLKENLEGFIAPQATFGVNCLASIRHCRKLRSLNLSLVSSGILHSELFRSISHITTLQTLYLPHSFVSPRGRPIIYDSWVPPGSDLPGCLHYRPDYTSSSTSTSKLSSHPYPPNLRNLHILGGLDSASLYELRSVPPTLRHLRITDTPRLDWPHLHAFVAHISASTQLRSLSIGIGIRFSMRDLVQFPEQYAQLIPPLPHLRSLEVHRAQFLSFQAEHLGGTLPERTAFEVDPRFPKLQHIVIRNNFEDPLWSAQQHDMEGSMWAISFNTLHESLDTHLPKLRRVEVDERMVLERTVANRQQFQQDRVDLDDLLKALAREDEEERRLVGRKKGDDDDDVNTMISEDDAGVILFGSGHGT